MKTSDITALVLLGALWGASFLFMRMGANEFGGMALAGMRAIGAAICSAPLLTRTRLTEMRTHWRDIAIVGIANSALPFVLFSFAAQSLPAGVSAISDAIAPLLVALSGWMLLGEKLSPMQASGLVIGFTGVVWLVAGTVGFGGGTHAMGWAMAACLGANVCYTFGAHYSHRRLRSGVTPLSVATGSQLAAAVLLLPFTVWMWPTQHPGMDGMAGRAGPGGALHVARLCPVLQLDGPRRGVAQHGGDVPYPGVRGGVGPGVPA